MVEPKTQKNDAGVEAFLNAVPDDKKRQDCFATLEELVRQSVEQMIKANEM